MKAVRVIRQSQGTEDSASLEQQRRETETLADDLGVTDLDTIDLGNHTGFSVHYKDPDEERIDNNEHIQTLVDDLQNGTYDYLLAFDDTRICRDQYYWTIQRAATLGGCEIEFVDDVPDDPLTFRVQRSVSAEQKFKEIKRSQDAIQERLDNGHWQGGVPIGMEMDDQGERLVPGDDFNDVLDLIDAKDAGSTHVEAIEESGLDISKPTVSNILDRRELYEQHA